ncbi:hypothetical protein XMIN_2784 [Xanthomonas citri pv. mangiferaeindicae LMG 941]|nr:hypothetical protein XMIN_2784 [Xanthomonas citri pv. mangiferaeindicae LMG 941]
MESRAKMPSITLSIVPAGRRNADSVFLHQHFSRGHFPRALSSCHKRHEQRPAQAEKPEISGFFHQVILKSDKRSTHLSALCHCHVLRRAVRWNASLSAHEQPAAASVCLCSNTIGVRAPRRVA